MVDSSLDVIVIGAGLSGIAFSRFYLDTHPKGSLIVLEEDTCVGGVWSSSRLYNAFWSQSGLRMAGFSDRAIELPPGAETYHDIFEAKFVTKYLEEYVDSHVYDGKSLRDRILFGFKVASLQKSADTWQVHGAGNQTISAPKLVVATGHTSRPAMPTLPGKDNFLGPILHQKDFGKASIEVFKDSSRPNVTVLGGGKSAADMVYASAKAGKNVAWIIRRDGEGPAAFAAAAGKGPYRNGPEIAATRMMSALSPSCFTEPNWLSSLIHGTARGRRIIAQIWIGADEACRKEANFEERHGALPGFANLRSSTRNVSVFRENLLELRDHSILLENGIEVPADTLFCGTGWDPHYPFLSKTQTVRLGLPHAAEDEDLSTLQEWNTLLEAADEEVVRRFPQLAEPPTFIERRLNATPTRLYNCIAPLSDKSILFLGNIYLSNAFRTAEAQAVWATAYLDNNIALPPTEQTKQEIAYMAAFSSRRYPSHGKTGNYFHMDLVGYTDKLLRDVGLVSHRKYWWWQDIFSPCLASDLSQVKGEYLAKFGKQK
ncbi:MAG: hypothetical protein Q9210_006624 [Variospora velana]